MSLQITNWHQGVGEPDLFGSLGLRPIRLSVVGQVVAGSAAAKAGLQPGDWIVGVNGEPVSQWSDWVSYIVNSPGRELTFEVLREGRTLFVRAVPEVMTVADGSTAGRLWRCTGARKSSVRPV